MPIPATSTITRTSRRRGEHVEWKHYVVELDNGQIVLAVYSPDPKVPGVVRTLDVGKARRWKQDPHRREVLWRLLEAEARNPRTKRIT